MATRSFSMAWMRSSRARASASAAWAAADFLGHPGPGDLQQGLGHDVALGHLAGLAAGGQEALHAAAAFDHRAAGGLAGQGHAGHGALAADDRRGRPRGSPPRGRREARP